MERVIKTKITEMLGIERPIIQGGMQWLAKAPLAAAVSNAGGLGIIASSTFPDREQLREEIKLCKSMTDKPFAINLSLFPSLNTPDYEGYIRVAAEEGVKVIETAGRAPVEYVSMIKDAGMVLMHKCVAVKHAKKAQSIGADIIVIDGYDAAGHIGGFGTGSMVLTPAAVDALDVPVACAGGIADGRGMAAALALGAEAVYMGTRFIATKECPMLDPIKQQVVDSSELDTYIALAPYNNPFRIVKNGCARKIEEKEKAGVPFAEVAPLASGRLTAEMVYKNGDPDHGTICQGTCCGLIHDVPTVKELMDRMMDECFAVMDKWAR